MPTRPDGRIAAIESLVSDWLHDEDLPGASVVVVDADGERYGYGWMRDPIADDVAVGHGGNIVVSTAYTGYLEDAGVGVVLASNACPELQPAAVGQAILALATGGEATDVPAIAVRDKCEAVTGRYAAFRDAVTATVERDGGGLSITFSGDFGDDEVTALPETLDADDSAFATVTAAGARSRVEFDTAGEQVDLFYKRTRLRRTGDV